MTEKIADSPSRRTTRTAGLFYLGLIGFGILAQFLHTGIVVAGDAAETARNIAAHGGLFRLSTLADLFMASCFFLLGLSLYLLFKKTNRTAALFMLVINAIGAPIMALNVLNQVAAQHVLSGAGYLKAFSTEQLQALSLFFLDLQGLGYLIAAISYGLYLLPLGYLILKSGFFPRLFGYLYLACGSLTMVDFLVQFLLPRYGAYSQILLYPLALVEIGFCLWLLGAKRKEGGSKAPMGSLQAPD